MATESSSAVVVCTLLVVMTTCVRGDGLLRTTIGPRSTTPGYVHLDAAMRNSTKYEGDTLRIKCEITGFPLPKYLWYKDGVLLDAVALETSKYSAKTTPWGSRLRVSRLTVDDSGIYACDGYNQYDRQTTNGTVTVKPGPNPNRDRVTDLDSELGIDDDDGGPQYDDRLEPLDADGSLYPAGRPDQNKYGGGSDYGGLPDYAVDGFGGGAVDDTPGHCQPYRGSACSSFLADRSVFVALKFRETNPEDSVTAVLAAIARVTELQQRQQQQHQKQDRQRDAAEMSQCAQFVAEALCHYAFPLCAGAVRRRLCRADCEQLETDICRPLYDIRSSHPEISSKLILPDCHQLDNGQNCVHIGLGGRQPSQPQVDYKHSCFNDSGKAYRGVANKVASGSACLKWNAVSVEYRYIGDNNYCRNPDNSMTAPWCFVDRHRRELCAVPKCRTTMYKIDDDDDDSAGAAPVFQIIVPCLVVGVVVGVLLFIVHRCRQRKTSNASTPTKNATPRKQQTSSSTGNSVELNPMLSDNRESTGKTLPDIIGSGIRYISELSPGQFGPLYKAELVRCQADTTRLVPVAVKTLSATASPDTYKDFWSEVERWSRLSHVNLVNVLGLCRGDSDCPTGLVYEFAFYGDLHEYLLVHSPHSDISIVDVSGRQQILQPSDMLQLAIQLSTGMEYLASQFVVHTDLATRNVLVGADVQLKISDLGLGRHTYPLDYYLLPVSKTPMPVRWMPPESIFFGQFSTSSDVWSFAVTLWEVYSYGLQPYYGYPNQEVAEMVRSHQLLPCPPACPSRLYALMLDCWQSAASARPSFGSIHDRLRHCASVDPPPHAFYLPPDQNCPPYSLNHAATPSYGDVVGASEGSPAAGQIVGNGLRLSPAGGPAAALSPSPTTAGQHGDAFAGSVGGPAAAAAAIAKLQHSTRSKQSSNCPLLSADSSFVSESSYGGCGGANSRMSSPRQSSSAASSSLSTGPPTQRPAAAASRPGNQTRSAADNHHQTRRKASHDDVVATKTRPNDVTGVVDL